jgi:phosphocarrier protein HPr
MTSEGNAAMPTPAEPLPESGGETVQATVLVTNPTGLHARPAVKLTKLAKSFLAEVKVRPRDQAEWVNAKSPNAVMKMKLRGGDTLCVEGSGSDAADAVAALVAFTQRNFDE